MTRIAAISRKKRNRVYFDDLDEALDDGYEPCKKCHPS